MPNARPSQRLFRVAVSVLTAATIVVTSPVARGETIVADFEDLPLAADSAVTGDPSMDPFFSHQVRFNRTWLTEFDCCPGAWAYSNRRDLTTPGVTNAYSAYHLPAGGGAEETAQFGVAFNASRGDALVDFPQPGTVRGMYVTNTTYAYMATVEGNDGAGFVKGRFADGDFFKLTIFGQDSFGEQTGAVDLYLADYRDGKSDALANWTWVDLTPLGNQVAQLQFELTSTDVGPFGMNTPAYFAADQITFVIPEPTGAGWLVIAAFGWYGARRRRQGPAALGARDS